jgi:hypothetical protein
MTSEYVTGVKKAMHDFESHPTQKSIGTFKTYRPTLASISDASYIGLGFIKLSQIQHHHT